MRKTIILEFVWYIREEKMKREKCFVCLVERKKKGKIIFINYYTIAYICILYFQSSYTFFKYFIFISCIFLLYQTTKP